MYSNEKNKNKVVLAEAVHTIMLVKDSELVRRKKNYLKDEKKNPNDEEKNIKIARKIIDDEKEKSTIW